MRVWVVVIAMVAAACGGGSSTPTSPTPQPIAAANLQLSGQGAFVNCSTLLNQCDFSASIQNIGTGCASSTTLVARFFDTNNSQLGADAQMGAVGTSLAARTIRAQEIVAVTTVVGVPLSVANNSRSYRLFPTWTDVRC